MWVSELEWRIEEWMEGFFKVSLTCWDFRDFPTVLDGARRGLIELGIYSISTFQLDT
jgi:hypothetical protein